MANQWKTFAYLDRGYPYSDVFAVSGCNRGQFGGTDGYLDRVLWTKRVFIFSRVLGHELAIDPGRNGTQPGNFNAYHADKQVMAFFLWKHTVLQEEPADDDDDDDDDEEEEEEKERWVP
jgi:hypothetical protein